MVRPTSLWPATPWLAVILLAIVGCRGKDTDTAATAKTQTTPTIGHESWLTEVAYLSDATPDQLKQEAVAVAENLTAAAPRSPRVLNVAARLYFTLGQSDKAVQLWQTSIEIDPQFVDGYFGLGLAMDDASDFATAGKMFHKVMALDPDEPRGPAYLAGALVKDGKLNEAVAMLLDHFRTHQPSIDSLEQLGLAYLQLKQFDKAKSVFETLVQVAPEERRGYYGLARVYARLGDRDKAAEFSKRFRERSSADKEKQFRNVREFSDAGSLRDILVRTLNEAGDAAASNGDDVNAEQLWRKAAVLAPTDIPSRHNLVLLYDRQQRDADGLLICRELCKIEPDHAEYWLNVGLLLGRLGRLQEARESVQRAIKLDPHDPRYQRAFQVLKDSE